MKLGCYPFSQSLPCWPIVHARKAKCLVQMPLGTWCQAIALPVAQKAAALSLYAAPSVDPLAGLRTVGLQRPIGVCLEPKSSFTSYSCLAVLLTQRGSLR